jgi:thiol:disulfide interchange protein
LGLLLLWTLLAFVRHLHWCRIVFFTWLAPLGVLVLVLAAAGTGSLIKARRLAANARHMHQLQPQEHHHQLQQAGQQNLRTEEGDEEMALELGPVRSGSQPIKKIK